MHSNGLALSAFSARGMPSPFPISSLVFLFAGAVWSDATSPRSVLGDDGQIRRPSISRRRKRGDRDKKRAKKRSARKENISNSSYFFSLLVRFGISLLSFLHQPFLHLEFLSFFPHSRHCAHPDVDIAVPGAFAIDVLYAMLCVDVLYHPHLITIPVYPNIRSWWPAGTLS